MFSKKSQSVVVEQPVVSQPVVEPDRNWVQEMARTAVAVLPIDGSAEAELDRLTALQGQLLPIERIALERVTERAEQLRAAKELPYSKLSLEPLRWRKNGRPVFAVYSLDTPECWLVSRFGRSFATDDGDWVADETLPPLPEPIGRALMGGLMLPRAMSLRSTFTGLIPPLARAEIAKAKPLFGEDVYIIAEANWEQVPSPRIDPLVVGWRAGALWLIAQFDLTDIENYFVSEFPG